jgi:uncharacterized protein
MEQTSTIWEMIRPGLKAARERGVRSPLLEAGFSKADIREVARSLGLSNWDKPAAACLSSRVPRVASPLRDSTLSRVERAEAALAWRRAFATAVCVITMRDRPD